MSARGPNTRARPPREVTQVATLAAWPPAAKTIAAGVSSSVDRPRGRLDDHVEHHVPQARDQHRYVLISFVGRGRPAPLVHNSAHDHTAVLESSRPRRRGVRRYCIRCRGGCAGVHDHQPRPAGGDQRADRPRDRGGGTPRRGRAGDGGRGRRAPSASASRTTSWCTSPRTRTTWSRSAPATWRRWWPARAWARPRSPPPRTSRRWPASACSPPAASAGCTATPATPGTSRPTCRAWRPPPSRSCAPA